MLRSWCWWSMGRGIFWCCASAMPVWFQERVTVWAYPSCSCSPLDTQLQEMIYYVVIQDHWIWTQKVELLMDIPRGSDSSEGELGNFTAYSTVFLTCFYKGPHSDICEGRHLPGLHSKYTWCKHQHVYQNHQSPTCYIIWISCQQVPQ